MAVESITRFRCTALRPSGASDVRMIQAASVEAARERLIAAGLEPLTITPMGPSLVGRAVEKLRVSPALPLHSAIRARLAALLHPAVAAKLRAILDELLWLTATTCITLMVGAWLFALAAAWQSDRIMLERADIIAQARQELADRRAREHATARMAAPGPTEILDRLVATLPAEAGVAAAARATDGALIVEIETPDPDQLRPALGDDPLLRLLREKNQSRTTEGTLRVTLTDRAQ